MTLPKAPRYRKFLDYLKFIHVPAIIKRFYSNYVWNKSVSKKTLYLTFDDGPIPEVTPWVLKTLKEYQAEATFFCIGENAEKHPELFKQLLASGHAIGNHTHKHLNGWKSNTKTYLENTEQANTIIQSKLFRPPYGKIRAKQAKYLLQKGYKIMMWSVLSRDYDASISQERCLNNVLYYAKPGSIVVFHDSLKAEKNLRYVLPKVLEFYSKKGYLFKKL